ncbi:hypothetical protein Aph01nite_66180 [Acrocarpospora phusangensis]|uniref:Uncharacterized protein n=1 Tax=Acrocarpospora phusangensis TaxID=1070424 RepID=A0A919US70_9ACTN|nr:hypothetical protein [Acrocarpospora phusangensis]GIH28308.1 hypothetical protein Aph01nite_66180 [Acrocarpospora phusangensis]
MAANEQSLRRIPAFRFAVPAALAVTLVWGGAIAATLWVRPPAGIQLTAQFGHLLALCAGFGAVLVIDTCGLLFLTGRQGAAQTMRVVSAADPVVWLGYAGLVVTGALLEPDLDSPLTWLKLAAVLVTGLNGIHARLLTRELAALPGDPSFGGLSRAQRVRLLLSGTASQAAWWTAILVGFWHNQAASVA